MKVFPRFPKTHSDGYITVIEIDESILNKKVLLYSNEDVNIRPLKMVMDFVLLKTYHSSLRLTIPMVRWNTAGEDVLGLKHVSFCLKK